MWIPIVAEKGFTKRFYEDDKYLFVYEGKPDLTVFLSSRRDITSIVDHKSQTRRSDYYSYNNQAIGYCWASEIDCFTYNFFGLQETGKPEDWFRRVSKIYTKQELDDWYQTTLKWFKKIANDEDYNKSMQCEGKYGICEFHKLCEIRDNDIRNDIIRREFKLNEYRSW